jgi:hypothetical protein
LFIVRKEPLNFEIAESFLSVLPSIPWPAFTASRQSLRYIFFNPAQLVAPLRSENTKSLPDWVVSIPDPTGLQYLTTNPAENTLPAIVTTTCN